MPRKTLLLALLFAASQLVLQAQQASQGHPTFVGSIAIPAIAGAPFSATLVIESEQYFYDDTEEVRRTIHIIARDSQGRTHNEVRRFMPESFHGSPQLLLVRLYDPTTHILTVCDPTHQTASRQLAPEDPKATNPPDPSIEVKDLGTDTFNGIPAKGTRKTVIISKPLFGWGKPTVVEDEEWYSKDLHLMLLVRHSDPRFGVQTLGVSGLKREEPPASMFEVPQGYKIVAEPPLSAPPATPPPNGVDPQEELPS